MGADRWTARLRREWVSLGVSRRSIGIIKGTNVRDGGRRKVKTLGRRIGEVDRPRAGTVVPFLGIACNGRGGGGACAAEAADDTETAGLAGNRSLEELLSGMLDKRLKTSPGIADWKVISGLTCRHRLDGR